MPEIQVLVGEGVRGDGHTGPWRLSDTREHLLTHIGVGKEVPIAGVRQWSAISVEDLRAVEALMQTPAQIPTGLLGENLVVSGIAGFSDLPPGCLLTFAKSAGTWRKAVLAVWAQNVPCHIPAGNIAKRFGSSFAPAKPFPIAARGLRGIVGFVYCSGKIAKGDIVEVWQ